MTCTKEDTLNKRFWNHWTFLSIIVVLTFLAYSNVLHGEFVFQIDSLVFMPLESFRGLDLWDAFKNGERPVATFTFSLNRYFWGKDPFSYHLTNLIIHMINGVLVYIFIYMTVTIDTRSAESREICFMPQASWIAFLVALLFSIHPIQTDAVSYIFQRFESLSSLFYLISLVSFIAAAEYGIKGLYLVFIASFVLSLGSKEIAVTLPVTAFLYGIFFFKRKSLWRKVGLPGAFIFAGLIVAWSRVSSLGKHPSVGYHLREATPWEYLLTQFSAVLTYLRLLILPFGQNIDHYYPLNRGLAEARTIIGFTFILLILYTAAALYKRRRSASFFILWFFILLLPTSSILPTRDLLVERRLYLPSLGVFFIFASSMAALSGSWKTNKGRKLFFILPLLVCLSCSLLAVTYARNRQWNSNVAIWEDSVGKSSKKARPHNLLGIAYSEEGMFEKAIEQFETALSLDRNYKEPHRGLGVAYYKKGYFEKAVEHFSMALESYQNDALLHNDIGIAYAELDMFDSAILHLETALKYKPGYAGAHSELGLVYEKMGRLDEAVKELKEAIRLEQDNSSYHYNLGHVYYTQKKFDKSIEHYKAALLLNPKDTDGRNNLGYIYYEQGRLQEALREFQTALGLKPDDKNIRNNIALVYDKIKNP